MKFKFDKNDLQRITDQFVVYAREFSSRGTSFIIVILGVILQASHTTLLMYSVSAFSNSVIRFIVSFGIGIFISSALAVFTLKHDGKNKHISNLIITFFYFEVFTNLFYYFNSILLSKGLDNLLTTDYVFFCASLPFAYIMPYAIKQFAGIIAADKAIEMGNIDVNEAVQQLSANNAVVEQLELSQQNMQNEINTQLRHLHQELEGLKQFDMSDFLQEGDDIIIENDAGKQASVKIKKFVKSNHDVNAIIDDFSNLNDM